jgi:cytochrome d ubiquinol oxidase subunit II
MHGGAYLALKADQPVATRAAYFASRAALVLIALFAIGGLWVALLIDGYSISGDALRDGPSNPLMKQVTTVAGGWLANYGKSPLIFLAPSVAFVGAALTILFLGRRRNGLATVASALTVAGVIATAGLSVFPFLLPSSLDPNASLTVWDASSSRLTLMIMLVATLIFLPIVLLYTVWVYRVLRGQVTLEYVAENSTSTY